MRPGPSDTGDGRCVRDHMSLAQVRVYGVDVLAIEEKAHVFVCSYPGGIWCGGPSCASYAVFSISSDPCRVSITQSHRSSSGTSLAVYASVLAGEHRRYLSGVITAQFAHWETVFDQRPGTQPTQSPSSGA
jgi:hypothetical protein